MTERSRERHALTLPAGERARVAIPELRAREPDHREQPRAGRPAHALQQDEFHGACTGADRGQTVRIHAVGVRHLAQHGRGAE